MGHATAERIGVFGGTFDPPHIGHAIVVGDLIEALRLDRLLVVPAANPPHRGTRFADTDRYEWTARVFAGVPRVEVSDLELRRDGPSYMVDTLREVRDMYHPADLYLIMGVDQFRLLDTWDRWEELPELAQLAVMRREGEVPAAPGSPERKIGYITADVTRIDVSSSRVRRHLSDGRTIRFIVPESIREDVERAWDARVEEFDTSP